MLWKRNNPVERKDGYIEHPRHKVARILAYCILIFYIIGTLGGIVLGHYFPDHVIFTDPVVAEIWADITKTLIGGLLVYIAAKGHDSDQPPPPPPKS